MIALLLLGHGNFGSAMLSACQMICGEVKNTAVIDFSPEYDIEALDKLIDTTLKTIDCSAGVLALCDLAGGSPFNRIMLRAMEDTSLAMHVIAGANLAMIIETATMREYENHIDKIIDQVMSLCQDSIIYGNRALAAQS